MTRSPRLRLSGPPARSPPPSRPRARAAPRAFASPSPAPPPRCPGHRDAAGGCAQRLCALPRAVRLSRVLRISLTGTISSVRRSGRRLSSQILVYQLLILMATLLVGVGLALRAAQSRLD